MGLHYSLWVSTRVLVARGSAWGLTPGPPWPLLPPPRVREAQESKLKATAAAQKLRAGQIYVNEWFAGGVETPFGGFGKSGYGREKGREALYNYVQTKNIGIALG